MLNIAILSGDEYADTDVIETHDIVIRDGFVTKNRLGSTGSTVNCDGILAEINGIPRDSSTPAKVVNVSHHYPPKSYRFEQMQNSREEVVTIVHVPIGNLPTSKANELLEKAHANMTEMGFQRVMVLPFRD